LEKKRDLFSLRSLVWKVYMKPLMITKTFDGTGELPLESVGCYRVRCRISNSKLFYKVLQSDVIFAFESTHLILNLQIWNCRLLQSWRGVLNECSLASHPRVTNHRVPGWCSLGPPPDPLSHRVFTRRWRPPVHTRLYSRAIVIVLLLPGSTCWELQLPLGVIQELST
jgi:hypothetical protein